jgi:CRP/FNR family transcriptional regulator, cyclic AMP receptor protein
LKLPNIFERGTTPVVFQAGETIFKEGQPAEFMYAIKRGDVEILKGDHLVEELGPDGFFGELALVDNSPRSATARAKTECELIPINEKHFMFMVGETPFFSLVVMRKMAERLRRKEP